MDSMNLRHYLSTVVDVEGIVYMQECILSQIGDRMDLAAQERTPQHPEKPEPPIREEEKSPSGLQQLLKKNFGWDLLRGGGISLLVALVWHFIADHIWNGAVFPTVTCSVLLFLGLLILFSVWAVLRGKRTLAVERKKRTDNRERQIAYEQAMTDYREAVQKAQFRYQVERGQQANRLDFLQEERQSVGQALQASEYCLQMLYDADILPKEYQKVEQAAYLYQLLTDETCDNMADACVLLKAEIGTGTLLELGCHRPAQLSQDTWASIQEHQPLLYAILQGANQQTDEILQELDDMLEQLDLLYGQHSELAQYRAEISKTSVISRYCTAWAEIEQRCLVALKKEREAIKAQEAAEAADTADTEAADDTEESSDNPDDKTPEAPAEAEPAEDAAEPELEASAPSTEAEPV